VTGFIFLVIKVEDTNIRFDSSNLTRETIFRIRSVTSFTCWMTLNTSEGSFIFIESSRTFRLTDTQIKETITRAFQAVIFSRSTTFNTVLTSTGWINNISGKIETTFNSSIFHTELRVERSRVRTLRFIPSWAFGNTHTFFTIDHKSPWSTKETFCRRRSPAFSTIVMT
jgi:hypothetical protein